MTDLADLSAMALLQGYRTGAFTPLEAAKAVLKRIKGQNKAVNAFILHDADAVLKEAEKASARWSKCRPKGLLDGVPVSIKEHVDVKGWPTRYASPVLPDKPAKKDAPLVKRLKEAGAVLLGKTATPEFCWKGVTDSGLYGVTRNPWDHDKTPGGSSGGAAAACALGMGPLHVGSDGGGSIRIPASFCGVFGIKPTSHRVPAEPGGPTAFLSQMGPITRTVEDAALMLSVIAQGDANDPFALPDDHIDYRIGLNEGVAGLRIGFWDGSRLTEINKQVAGAIAKAADVFADMGARVEEADPGFDEQLDTFLAFWQPMTAYYLEDASEEALAQSEPLLVRSAQKGAQIPITRHYQALAVRAALAQRMAAFHEKYDLLLAPVTPVPAFQAGAGIYGPAGDAYKRTWASFTFPFNLTGQPAVSVPCGLTRQGLPIAFQLVAPWRGEGLLLRAARAYESEKPFRMPGNS